MSSWMVSIAALLKNIGTQMGLSRRSNSQPPPELSNESPLFSKNSTTPDQLAKMLSVKSIDILHWLDHIARTKDANDQAFYEMNSEFNQSLDLNSKVNIGSSSFSRSYLLFMTDRIAYREQLDEWNTNQDEQKIKFVKDNILSLGENEYRLSLLIHKIQKKKITPFVGAGLSMAAGLPGWSNFLIKCAESHELNLNDVKSLLQNGDFEGCADYILKATHPDLLKEKFQIYFQEPDESTYSHELLTKIANWGLVTTNYDKLVERTYERYDSKFNDIFYGQEEEIHSEFVDGNHVLLKMHGDINRPSKRILTTDEYNRAYGNGRIDVNLPLPRFFTSFFSNNGLLFLGCSLFNDRTMKLLKHIKENSTSGVSHFAIVPLVSTEKQKRETFLVSHGIYPIWYPENDHKSLEYILTYIQDRILEN